MLSMELVPRSIEGLVEESAACWGIREIRRINVPDIRRLNVRSHDAASALLDAGFAPIPHLRTRDRSLSATLELLAPLFDKGLKEVLVVSGDPQPGEVDSGVSPIDLIPEILREFKDAVVYGGLDPYRQSPLGELEYARAKLKAGATGLFSQPFFETDYLQFWQRFFGPGELWAGISPVQSLKTREYWEKINRVPFAKEPDFSPEGLARTALELLDCAATAQQHAYLMPIRMPAAEYLALLEQWSPRNS
jgi:methylenetetrahydrofolate reductase (NADPH)